MALRNGSICKTVSHSEPEDRRQATVCLDLHWKPSDIQLFRGRLDPAWDFAGPWGSEPTRTIEVTVVNAADGRALTVEPLAFDVSRASGPALTPAGTTALAGIGPSQKRKIPHKDGFIEKDDPAFGIADVAAAKEKLAGHANASRLDKWAEAAGPVFQSIYKASQSEPTTPEGRQFVEGILQLISTSSLLTGTAFISGADKLDQEPIDAPGHALHGRALVPRMVTHRFDQFWTEEVLSPLQARLFVGDGAGTSLFDKTIAAKDVRALVLANRALAEWVAVFLQDRHRHAAQYLGSYPPEPYTVAPSVEAVMRSVNQIAARTHSVVLKTLGSGGEDSEKFLGWAREILATDNKNGRDDDESDRRAILGKWHSPAYWTVDLDDANWLPGRTYAVNGWAV